MRPTAIWRRPPIFTRRRWNSYPVLLPHGSRSARRAKRWAIARVRARHSRARLRRTATTATALQTYVRTLFDQYAPRFDRALEDLSYSAPAKLRGAVMKRGTRFGSMLDLGCGTGLAGAAFRPHVDWLAGVDLSPKMVEQARAKGLYDRLAVADIGSYLAAQLEAVFHLVIAADVFAYVADVADVCAAVKRVLSTGGLFAFTVEPRFAWMTHGANLHR